jgi:hypothetical protein
LLSPEGGSKSRHPSLIRIYVLCDGISANGIAKIGSDVIGAERRFAVFVDADPDKQER